MTTNVQDNAALTVPDQAATGLADAIEAYDKLCGECLAALESMRQANRHLQTQNQYLRSENDAYRRKLSRITETRLGKLAMNLYTGARKLKWKLDALFGKRMKR